jgi:type IV pilus assembly protein PilB
MFADPVRDSGKADAASRAASRTDDLNSPTPVSGRAVQFVPVLSNNRELAAYLAAYAAGRPGIDPALRWNDTRWRAAGKTDEDFTTFQRAHKFGLPLVLLESINVDPAAIHLVSPAIARRSRLVPLALHDDVLAVAVENPADADAVATLNFLSDKRIALLVADPKQIRATIADNYDHVEDAAIARQLGLSARIGDDDLPDQRAQALALEQPVVRLVADIFADAVRRRASDIHLRPDSEGIDLLYRIDDELVAIRHFLRVLQPALVSRIKVLGGMNVAEHRTAQDGRATYAMDEGREVDMRISILPTIHGESVVLRLLDTSAGLRSIAELGFTDTDASRFVDLMTRNFGMILVTGPTGSGKSTTLYAALLEAARERVNILTVEDPVEYHIDDIQQMQVNRAAGFTFATALRNILRHDPDVIMVGEIRDRETALIAVESALTGHLLLSSLHTNTAATSITRLLDLGVESYLLRSTLLGVLSQRLARRNCPHCAEPENVPAHWRETLHVADDEVFHRGAGCQKCEGLGVHGRLAVYELLTATSGIRRLIRPKCDAEAIHRMALREGMTPITQHAVALARAGTISLNEAFRLRAD